LTFPAYSVKTQAPLFGCFNYSCLSVTVCICHAELKSYLLANLPGGETSWGETSRGRTDKRVKRP